MGRTKGYPAPLQPSEPVAQPAKARKRTGAVAPSTPSYGAPGGYSSFPSVNEPTTSQIQAATAQSPGGNTGKKRGRPTKDVIAQRAAEYAERGIPYPPPKRSKKPSVEGAAPMGMTLTPSGESQPVNIGALSAEGTPASSGPKKRSRPKAPKEPRGSLEATANAAYALGGQGEGQPVSNVPGGQIATQGLPEGNLLAGLQEHAELVEPTTTEDAPRMQPEQPSNQAEKPQQPIEKLQELQQQPIEQIQEPQQELERHQQQQPSTQPQADTESYQTPYQQDSAV